MDNAKKLKMLALKAINKLYRNDPWVRQLYNAAGFTLEEANRFLDELLANGFFDIASERAIRIYEKELGIEAVGSLDERRKRVELLWKTAGKCTLEKIEAVVKTFVLDEIEVKFENGKIRLEFDNSSFIYALPKIRENLEIVKPAHIGMEIADVHLVTGDVYAASYCTRKSAILIEPNIEFSTLLGDAQIAAAVYITRSYVKNNIIV